MRDAFSGEYELSAKTKITAGEKTKNFGEIVRFSRNSELFQK